LDRSFLEVRGTLFMDQKIENQHRKDGDEIMKGGKCRADE
jgi:hypothetical protein